MNEGLDIGGFILLLSKFEGRKNLQFDGYIWHIFLAVSFTEVNGFT